MTAAGSDLMPQRKENRRSKRGVAGTSEREGWRTRGEEESWQRGQIKLENWGGWMGGWGAYCSRELGDSSAEWSILRTL